MRRSTRFKLALVLSASVLTATGPLWAQHSGARPGERNVLGPRATVQIAAPEDPIGSQVGEQRGDLVGALRILSRHLELNERQVAHIRAVLAEAHEANRALRQELHALELELRSELRADIPDQLTVGALVIQIHDLKSRIHERHDATREAVKAILTPEQLRKVAIVVQAARLQPVVRAFRLLGLLPPPNPPLPGGDEGE